MNKHLIKDLICALGASVLTVCALAGGKIYVGDDEFPLEPTNKLSQIAMDQTTVADVIGFSDVTNVTVDGISVASNKTAAISSFGRFKRLGKYIWEATTEGEDWNAATNLLEKHYPSVGSCSGVHAGHFHGRTYDWYFDKCAEFVVRNPARDGKPASIGIASGFKSLTDDFVESGKWIPSAYMVPFAWVDGMNEHGVVIQGNVTPSNHVKSATWRTKRDGCVSTFLVIRQVLDVATNALSAAQWINEHVYIPPTFQYDCHYLVSDATSCYIVEDGEIVEHSSTTPTDVLTNFRVRGVTFTDGKPDWNTVEPYGMGLERYEDVRNNGFDKTTSDGMMATMKRLFYTKSYDKELATFWYTEYVGDHTSEGYEDLKVTDALTDEGRTKFTGYVNKLVTEQKDEQDATSENYRGGKSWQTVHFSVYDQENLTLRIVTQEDESSEMLFTLDKNPGNFKVDMYKEYADETVTNGILASAKEYTNNYTNQAPDYVNVSNKAVTALQASETLTGVLKGNGTTVSNATADEDYAKTKIFASDGSEISSDRSVKVLKRFVALTNSLFHVHSSVFNEDLKYDSRNGGMWCTEAWFLNQQIGQAPNPTYMTIYLHDLGETFRTDSLPSNILDGQVHEIELTSDIGHSNATFTVQYDHNAYVVSDLLATTNDVIETVASESITNGGARVYADSKFATMDGIRSETSLWNESNTTLTNTIVRVTDDVVTNVAFSILEPTAKTSVETALTEMLGSDWKTTYGTGAAGIIAAILAALAWLKKNKQDTLVSSGTGQNVKTINNNSILGSGNIDIESGSTTEEALFDPSGTDEIGNSGNTPTVSTKMITPRNAPYAVTWGMIHAANGNSAKTHSLTTLEKGKIHEWLGSNKLVFVISDGQGGTTTKTLNVVSDEE